MSTPLSRPLLRQSDVDIVISYALGEGDFVVLLCRFPYYAACRLDAAAGAIAVPNFRDRIQDGLVCGPVDAMINEYVDWTSRETALSQFELLIGHPLAPSLVGKGDVVAECA